MAKREISYPCEWLKFTCRGILVEPRTRACCGRPLDPGASTATLGSGEFSEESALTMILFLRALENLQITLFFPFQKGERATFKFTAETVAQRNGTVSAKML